MSNLAAGILSLHLLLNLQDFEHKSVEITVYQGEFLDFYKSEYIKEIKNPRGQVILIEFVHKNKIVQVDNTINLVMIEEKN